MSPRHHPSARRRFPVPAVLAAAAVLGLAACSSGGGLMRVLGGPPASQAQDRTQDRTQEGTAASSPHPVVRYVVEAPEGARSRLDDPLVGGLVDVEVGRAYTSATAAQCKRFNTTAAAGERTVRTWAVCREARGDWALVTAGAAPLAGR